MKILCGSVSLACVLACLTVHAGAPVPLPEARLTIKTVDDDGQPLSNMPVHVWLSESAIRDGQTDTNGLFVAEGTCTIKDIPISIVKQGYYDSRLRYSYPNYLSVKDHKWQPWDPVVTALVRRVVNPIPMYAKRVEARVPIENAPLGFDLDKGDWVQPYGEGNKSDLIFCFSRRVANLDDYDGRMSIQFPKALDGIAETPQAKGSVFSLPRFAPETGYETNLVYRRGKNPQTGYYGPRDEDPKASYIFRVRSVMDATGRLKEACYGKILGGIRFSGIASDKFRVEFTFYLNPTPNDRNLEFDPKQNLFKNLGTFERVEEP